MNRGFFGRAGIVGLGGAVVSFGLGDVSTEVVQPTVVAAELTIPTGAPGPALQSLFLSSPHPLAFVVEVRGGVPPPPQPEVAVRSFNAPGGVSQFVGLERSRTPTPLISPEVAKGPSALGVTIAAPASAVYSAAVLGVRQRVPRAPSSFIALEPVVASGPSTPAVRVDSAPQVLLTGAAFTERSTATTPKGAASRRAGPSLTQARKK